MFNFPNSTIKFNNFKEWYVEYKKGTGMENSGDAGVVSEEKVPEETEEKKIVDEEGEGGTPSTTAPTSVETGQHPGRAILFKRKDGSKFKDQYQIKYVQMR